MGAQGKDARHDPSLRPRPHKRDLRLDKNEGSQTGDYFYTNAKEYLSDGIKIESVIDTGGIATVKYHSNALNKTCTAILVKEDGFWRIQEVRTIKEEMDTIFQK